MKSKEEWFKCLAAHYPVDNAEVDELIEMFLSDIDIKINKLKSFPRTEKQIAETAGILHGIKGSSAYLYLDEMKTLVQKMESDVHNCLECDYFEKLKVLRKFFSDLKQW